MKKGKFGRIFSVLTAWMLTLSLFLGGGLALSDVPIVHAAEGSYFSGRVVSLDTGTSVVLACEDVHIKDTVSYQIEDADGVYSLKLYLMDVTDPVNPELVSDKDGKSVEVITELDPKEGLTGEVEVYFGYYEKGYPEEEGESVGEPLDLSDHAGCKLVVCGELEDPYGETVYTMEDLRDVYQMIWVPGLDTKADPVESGRMAAPTDVITYDPIRYSIDYAYVMITGIMKGNGDALTKQDVELFAKRDVFRSRYSQTIPMDTEVEVVDRFEYKSVPDEGDYKLFVALYDKTTKSYLYDKKGELIAKETDIKGDPSGDMVEVPFVINTAKVYGKGSSGENFNDKNLAGDEIVALELFYRIQDGTISYDFIGNVVREMSFYAQIPVVDDINETEIPGALEKGGTYDLTFTLRNNNDAEVKDVKGKTLTFTEKNFTPQTSGDHKMLIKLLSSGADPVNGDVLFENDTVLHCEVSPKGQSKTAPGVLKNKSVYLKRYDGTEFEEDVLILGEDAPDYEKAGEDGILGTEDDDGYDPSNIYLDYPKFTSAKTIIVDNKGTLTGASGFPFVLESASESVEDWIPVGGAIAGQTCDLTVTLFADGSEVAKKKLDHPFTKTGSEYIKVCFDGIDTRGVSKFTVTEELDPDDGMHFIGNGTPDTTAKKLPVVSPDYINGEWIYNGYFIKGTYMNPTAESGFLSVSQTANTVNLGEASCVFVNEMYLIDQNDVYSLVAVHDDIHDTDEMISLVSSGLDKPEDGSGDGTGGSQLKKGLKTYATEGGDHRIDKTSGMIEIKDRVEYAGYPLNTQYYMIATLVDKKTGEEVTDSNGDPIKNSVQFTTNDTGFIEVSLSVDASTLSSGHEYVVFETMTDVTGKEVDSHRDKGDAHQTVIMPGEDMDGRSVDTYFMTTALVDGKHEIADLSGKVTIIDSVVYGGYEKDVKYNLNATLVDKKTGRALVDERNRQVTAAAAFISKGDGDVDVAITVDGSLLEPGGEYVVYEVMTDDAGNEVAVHQDINDEGQTVKVIGAKALINGTDGVTAGESGPYFRTKATANGAKFMGNTGQYTIRDVVEYKGYEEYDGTEMVMVGYLVDGNTEEVLLDENEEPISARKEFTCKGTGSVEMLFEIDTEGFEVGDKIVVYENMLVKADDTIVASHLDPKDAAQTITIKGYSEVQTGTPLGFERWFWWLKELFGF